MSPRLYHNRTDQFLNVRVRTAHKNRGAGQERKSNMIYLCFQLSTKPCMFEHYGRLQTDKFVLKIYYPMYSLSKCYPRQCKVFVYR